MDKAIKTTKLKCKLGHTTLVLTEKGEFLFRAYETARLFGFRDDKECIRSYSWDARLIVMETDGGRQPVKCISMEDVIRIAGKSRIPQAKDMANSLRLIQKDQEIESLKIHNLLLADDLECAIDGLKGIREQLDLLFCDLGVNG